MMRFVVAYTSNIEEKPANGIYASCVSLVMPRLMIITIISQTDTFHYVCQCESLLRKNTDMAFKYITSLLYWKNYLLPR